MNADSHDDDDIRLFREEYPDIYEFVLKVLDGNCNDAKLLEFKDDYGKDCVDYILNIISGKASEKDIQEFREEWGNEIYYPIVKMMQKMNPAIKDAPESGPLREKFKKGDFIGQKYEFYDVLGEGEFGNKRVRIDDIYEYEIDAIKEGGMGKVLILNRISDEFADPHIDALMKYQPQLADQMPFKYRNKLAAKTFRDDVMVENSKALFERELNMWINIDAPNVAKLLKIVFINRKLFALMPYYSSNLRETINKGPLEIDDAKIVIINVIAGLHETFKQYGIVHQDLKPENILINHKKDRTYFFVSDWGIANLQKRYCPTHLSKELVDSYADTMTGMGTVPYMSPERFVEYSSHMTSDVFSLGMIFFELLFGHLPYDLKSGNPLVTQIMNQDYFRLAEYKLRKNYDDKIASLILKCIHPDMSKRYTDYGKMVLEIHNINIKRKFFFF